MVAAAEAPPSASVYAAAAKAEAERKRERICIVGGGFGGLYTVLRLSKLPWSEEDAPQITLIDKRDKFVFMPLLYQLAAGDADLSEVAPTYRSLLRGTDICFVQATVDGLDSSSKSVTVRGARCDDLDGYVLADEPDEQRTIAYDKLVLALGAEPIADMVEGAQEHAIPFYTVEDSYRLQRALRQLQGASQERLVNVVVVGGSLCGVETAATVDGVLDGRAVITIVNRGPELLATAAKPNREAAAAKLRRLGVHVLSSTSVERVAAEGIYTRSNSNSNSSSDGADSSESEPSLLPADLVVWTAGSKPNALLQSLELPLDERGRVRVDPQLCVQFSDSSSSSSSSDVYCLGDCAAVQGSAAAATAQVAMQQSEYVAWNLWAGLTGAARPLPFRYTDLGEMLSLGATDGTVSALNEVVNLKGPLAALARRAVYAARMPTAGQRVQAATSIAALSAVKLTNAALETGLDLLERFAPRSKQ